MVEKFIASFKALQNPIFNKASELEAWKSQANNIIIRVYGQSSKQEESINKIKFRKYVSLSMGADYVSGGHNGKDCQNQARETIQGFIHDLENFGLPELKTDKKSGISISVNQNQSQSQSVALNIILDSIKDELSGSQVRQIEEIINGNDKPDDKRKKIFDKIKSFGSDVASNVIANLLTNPALFS